MSRERKVAPRSASAQAAQVLAVNERLLISSIREQAAAEVANADRARLEALLGALNEGVIIAVGNGDILMVNVAARGILEMLQAPAGTAPARTEVDGVELRGLDGHRVPVSARPLARALRGEPFGDAELVVVRADATTRRVLASGTSIREGGAVVMAIVVLRDVTEIRRLETQREEFLALISHDLRGPVTAIGLVAASMKRELAGEGRHEVLSERVGRIDSNAGRMATMITELLQVAGLETHGAMGDREPRDLAALLATSIGRLDDGGRARVVVTASSTPPCVVLAAPSSLERAFENLLANALKYSPGAVRVDLAARAGQAVIEVSDDGAGIPQVELEHLFDRYYRAASGHPTGGLGLGLYIARLIAQAHGGHVSARSRVGFGSTFTLAVPLHLPS